MSRTKLRQLEQLRSSEIYTDTLNQGDGSASASEGQSGGTIGTPAVTVVSVTSPSTIIVSGDFVTFGAIAHDMITISGGPNDGIIAAISSLSYSTGQTTFTVMNPSSPLTTDVAGGVTATVTVDPNKSLETDLNRIRTQLKKLSRPVDGYWYSDPVNQAVDMFSTQTNTTIPAGNPVDVAGDFNAGIPYDLNVFMNGDLLQPSTITAHAVSALYDYQEVDDDGYLVQVGEVGRKVVFNFDLVPGDILQFIWNK